MFHPTVFENLKVALENQIYDYDNIDGILEVTGRTDVLDLAVLAREFTLSFKLKGPGKVTSEIVLRSSVKDLGDEILEVDGSTPGCTLLLRFHMSISDAPAQCPAIESILAGYWGPELKPEQTLSFRFGSEATYDNCVTLPFGRQINEAQMEDLPELLETLLQCAGELENV
nr:hypothetical protein [Paenibacillus tengchongensis]